MGAGDSGEGSVGERLPVAGVGRDEEFSARPGDDGLLTVVIRERARRGRRAREKADRSEPYAFEIRFRPDQPRM